MNKYQTSKELELISIFWVKVLSSNNNQFYIYFETEFERDKYIRRSRYFKNIRIIDYDDLYKYYR